jgi:integrase
MSNHRRGRGEGSIYKRSDGRWAGAVTIGYRNDTQHRKTIYGRTRKQVQERINTALQHQAQGIPLPGERQTVRDYLMLWLSDVVKSRVRPRTYESYDSTIRLHIQPYLGRVSLAKLTPQRVQRWLADLEAAGASPRTRQYARVVLRTALNQAVKWNLVVRNAAALANAPRVVTREIKPLDPKQAQRLLKHCPSHRLGSLFAIALSLGLRLGEALGLRWSDVDLQQGQLHIRRILQRTKEGVVFGELKTPRANRTLSLPNVAISTLTSHRVRQLEQRLAAGSRWSESDLVFTNRNGKPLDRANVRKQFHSLLESANLPKIRIHDLRHTAATLLLLQGVNPRTVMELLGHSDVTMTLNTYSHVLASLKEDAARRMDTALATNS